MQILTNADGYVVSYAIEGNLVGGVEVTAPGDMEHFEANHKAYRLEGDEIVLDADKAAELAEEAADPSPEERIAELEEALSLLLSGVTE